MWRKKRDLEIELKHVKKTEKKNNYIPFVSFRRSYSCPREIPGEQTGSCGDFGMLSKNEMHF